LISTIGAVTLTVALPVIVISVDCIVMLVWFMMIWLIAPPGPTFSVMLCVSMINCVSGDPCGPTLIVTLLSAFKVKLPLPGPVPWGGDREADVDRLVLSDILGLAAHDVTLLVVERLEHQVLLRAQLDDLAAGGVVEQQKIIALAVLGRFGQDSGIVLLPRQVHRHGVGSVID
jgi:hypothetical protein